MELRHLWWPVVPATVRPAESSQSSETQFHLRALWRSVVSTTVRAALPSQSSESRFPVPKFQSLSVLARRHSTVCRDHDGPSYDPSTQSIFITVILLLEMTKQVITMDTNLPIVRPRTITRRKTRARKSTWICKKVWISFLHISLLIPSGLFDWPILLLNLDGWNLPWSQLADFSI